MTQNYLVHAKIAYRILLLCWGVCRLYKTMGDIQHGCLKGFLSFFLFPVPIMAGAYSGFFFEQSAKRTHAFKPHRIADLGYSERLIGQQLLCVFDSFLGKVLMRGLLVNACKKTMKMKARDAGFPRDLIETERLMKTMVYVQFSRDDFFIYILV
jgi:hypothetical protein